MSLRTTEKIYLAAQKFYSNKLEYHNFQHIKDTLEAAERLLFQCDEKNISYDKHVICHAILFHDAGFEENHKKKGYSTKEDYSADIAASVLNDASEDQAHISAVENAILCTKMHASCDSINDNIVRAADLSGLASSYDDFKPKSINLFREREYMTGETISWEQYRSEAADIIENFVEFQIDLDVDVFADGNNLFRQRVFANLTRLKSDTLD